jgi:NitT/TauT family transport system permease protein
MPPHLNLSTRSVVQETAPHAETAWTRFVHAISARKKILINVVSVLLFFLAWEYIGTSGLINPLFVSSPSAIAQSAVGWLKDGSFFNDLYVSGTEFGIGFALAIVTGIPFGILLGWYRTFNYVFEPFVFALNATPRVALVPLLIIWFGIGIWSKVAIVFLGAFFPLVLNAYSGVRTMDDVLLRAARSFGANDWQIFRTITLPSSVPFVLAGLRVGLGHALVGIVIGELVAATAGIGYEMAIAGATFETARLFDGILLITTAGVLLTWAIGYIEHRFDAWRPQRT